MTTSSRVVYVIGTAAPPVRDLPQLFELLHQRGWKPCPVLTPTAATWVDVDELGEAASCPVRVDLRLPDEEEPLPPADAVLAAPLSFNTLNKWAAGISDTLALGLLNELLGTDVPIVAAPCAKAPLRTHPAYATSLKTLEACGVTFLHSDATVIRPREEKVSLDWPVLADELA